MPWVWDVPPSQAFTELFDFKTRQIYYKAWDVAKRRAQEIDALAITIGFILGRIENWM